MANINKTNNIHGAVAAGWESLLSVFEQNFVEGRDLGASLCVYYQGKCVVDLCGGWRDLERNKEPYTPDTLQLIFSASKGVMSAALALCVGNGWLDYDAPVAKYWPEFAANDKQNITVGEVLSHRAGLPVVDDQLTLNEACNWSRMTSLLARQKPQWISGTAHGYHPLTTGFIGGELVRRVDPQHRSFAQFVRDELDSEFYMGTSTSRIEKRVAPLIEQTMKNNPLALPSLDPLIKKAFTLNGAFPLTSESMTTLTFNQTQVHQAELPAANGITNARSLARIYARLLGDINKDGQVKRRLINETTLSKATSNVTPVDEPDRILFGTKSCFTKGGFRLFNDFFKTFGTGLFGHKGMGGSCALGYPQQQLAFAHVCNYLDFSPSVLDPRTVRLLEVIEDILKTQNKSSINLLDVNPINQNSGNNL